MKNFKVIKDGDYAVRNAGYVIDFSDGKLPTVELPEFFDNLTAPERERKESDLVDSLYDLDRAMLCEDEDGILYAVETCYDPKNGNYVPAAWAQVKKG